MAIQYRKLYDKGLAILNRAIPDNPDRQLDARLFLEAVCGTRRETLLVYPEKEVSEEEENRFLEMIRRRAEHEPVAYILGEQDFYGLPFRVTKDVLIPNQDTENLVEETLKDVRDGMRILDLCTGSGCILLSLLYYSDKTTGVGTDLSREALEVAGENGKNLGLSDRVSWMQGDLYDALKEKGSEGGEKFDIIVSNPPYIPTEVIPTLMPEVREKEPYLALDGGRDGLSFYRRILDRAGEFLADRGVLYFETGFDEAKDVAALMNEKGYVEIRIMKDYGGQDRVVRGKRGC